MPYSVLLPIAALIVIVSVSLFVVRVGATALKLTGLSESPAHFQAYSAFFGVGFTTAESELIMVHPVRRRVVLALILVGNVGLTSALGALIVAFVQTNTAGDALYTIAAIVVAASFLIILARSKFAQKMMDPLIIWTLKRAGVDHAQDYAMLLNLNEGYSVCEVDITDEHEAAGHTLFELRPEGVLVLTVFRDKKDPVPTPGGEYRIEAGDRLIIYGSEAAVERFGQHATAPHVDDEETVADWGEAQAHLP